MKLIIACDPKGGIGKDNKLPWDRIEGDLPRFKRLTDKCPIIMGRNTWDSLPTKPLIGRLNIVVTSRPLSITTGGVAIKSISSLADTDSMWMIGGAKLINSHWDLIDEIHLTKTLTEYDCDTYIDIVKLENTYRLEHQEMFKDHEYRIYKR